MATKHELSLAMSRIRNIHFVGIGGIGMSGIAEIFFNLGFSVSGSDLRESDTITRLRELGIRIMLEHSADNVAGVDVVVVSSAINTENTEVQTAMERHIPIIRRAEMLGELMRFRFGIAVAGTHGKTTTTSLIASVMTEAGFDPTYVIGGKLSSSSLNARLGAGRYLVAEADESDASFTHLTPMVAIVTNIDQDHMETYGFDEEKLDEGFLHFLHNMPFYGLAVLCVDDPGVQRIMNKVSRPILTYGFSEEADYQAINLSNNSLSTRFTVRRKGGRELEVELNMPGRHNVSNALAVIAVADELGVADGELCFALKNFSGIGRRFQRYGKFAINASRCEIVDDYAHHPRELEATIEAARQYAGKRRLMLVFQPHRFSRTRDLFDDFVRVLSSVDALVLMDVYPAGESPIQGASSEALAQALRARGGVEPVVASDYDELCAVLPGMIEDEDVLVFCGAGDIGRVAPALAKAWKVL
jgi:UDP-N-acetylmuramate--alanine ligase